MNLRMLPPRVLVATLVAALFAVTLAACGSEAAADPDPATAQSPTEAASTEAARAVPLFGDAAALPEEVTACLTDRGYADALDGRAALRDAAVQSALQDCATEVGVDLPFARADGAPGDGRPGFDTAALAECLASEGIEVSPDASGGLLNTLDRADPEVAAALEVCGFGGQGRGPAQ